MIHTIKFLGSIPPGTEPKNNFKGTEALSFSNCKPCAVPHPHFEKGGIGGICIGP